MRKQQRQAYQRVGRHRWTARLAPTVVLAMAAGVVMTAPATTASATSPPASQDAVGPGSDPAARQIALNRALAQAPLVAAATVLKQAVDASEQTGYAGIGLADGHVTLWWKGQLPTVINDAVDAARRIATVVVAPAAYSRAELRQAAAKAQPANGAARYAVKMATDGSGLVISVDAATPVAPTVPAIGVPTRVVRETRKQPRSRDDDTPLWRGGTIMWSGPGCTAGFGVKDASGARYILTAGHCGIVGSQWTDSTGESIGTMVARNQPHDVALIATPLAGDTIYAGGLYDERQLVITGWTPVFPGQLLCQSGRTMAMNTGGPMCNIAVQFFYTDSEDLVEATQLDGEEVAYSGDSGGPVYAPGPNGTALAAGTLTRSGGAGLGFQDFATARADFGIEPLVATMAACHVSYVVTDSWSGGFNASVTVRNDGPAVAGWSLGWTFTGPGDQIINGAWNAQSTQVGQRVSAVNAPQNAAIASGASVSFGFNAGGSATTPGLFTLNGSYCV